MYIHEVSKLTGTTKKAIEYYCRKGLLQPTLSENGYRLFSEEDVSLLKRISLLRNMGVSVDDIHQFLIENDDAVLQKILKEREHYLQVMAYQNELLKELFISKDWQSIYQKASLPEAKESITQRLINAFPGFYGKYVALHFGRFLQEPISTEEQKKAYREICEYLDEIQFEIPEDLEQYLDEINTEITQELITETDAALAELTEDPESYLQNHKEMIEKYLEFKNAEEYQNTPAYRLTELLRRFQQEHGYNVIFIPAMRRLSPSYEEYMTKLQKADQVFMKRYPSSVVQ